jgi:hypothetical protein
MMQATDSRTRAQRYADSRWWAYDGVKTVGYAIHRPEFSLGDRSRVYSAEIFHCDGLKTTRWVCVATYVDGSGYIYECGGVHSSMPYLSARAI